MHTQDGPAQLPFAVHVISATRLVRPPPGIHDPLIVLNPTTFPHAAASTPDDPRPTRPRRRALGPVQDLAAGIPWEPSSYQ